MRGRESKRVSFVRNGITSCKWIFFPHQFLNEQRAKNLIPLFSSIKISLPSPYNQRRRRWSFDWIDSLPLPSPRLSSSLRRNVSDFPVCWVGREREWGCREKGAPSEPKETGQEAEEAYLSIFLSASFFFKVSTPHTLVWSHDSTWSMMAAVLSS